MGTESISALTAVLRNALRKSERSGITFTVDKNIIKDFSFIKPGGDQEGLDGLHMHIEEKSIRIKFSGYDNYLNRILDKNKKQIQGNEANTLLPISRFLV